MAETESVKQDVVTDSTENNQVETHEEPKMFTQDDVNNIVNKRFKEFKILEEKARKFDEMEEASKTELQKATERAEKLESELASLKKVNEINEIRSKVASETGVPASLINGEDEETCIAQAKAILEFKTPNTYPNLKDGGEVGKEYKGTAQQQFSDWFNEHF